MGVPRLEKLSLIRGEQRVFEPDLGTDLITFGESSQFETFLGTRYYLPWRYLKSQRLRSFLQARSTTRSATRRAVVNFTLMALITSGTPSLS